MTCHRGTSWSRVAAGSDNLHMTEIECSDAGICDTSTGECTCFPGYEGSACQRTVCPNDCSGHGTCRSNQDFAVDFSEAVYAEQIDVDSTIVECPTSYDPMDKETCLKYSEWEKWGTYATNENSKVLDDGSTQSPSLGLQGNTILIREWNAPTRKASGSKPAAVAPVPYNPIHEYPCNGAPAGDFCS